MTMNKINNLRQPNAGFERTDRRAMVPPGCQSAGLGAVSAWVAGVPAPQGSKRPLGRQGGFGKHIMIESSKKVAPWREDVRQAFLDCLGGGTPVSRVHTGRVLDGPVVVKIVFVLPRTKAMRNRPAGDFPMVQKPDLDKLGRAVLDALKSAGVYADDSQVVTLLSHKRRAEPGEPTGAMIHIERDPSRCQPLCRMLKNGQGGHPGPCMLSPEERVGMSMFDPQPLSDLG